MAHLTRSVYLTALCFSLLINNAVQSQNFQLVKDINTVSHSRPVAANIQPQENDKPFTTVNNIGYFLADDGIHGNEPWRTDGTANGTYLLKDIYTGTVSSNISYITAFKKGIVFSAKNGAENKLWISDGTEAGTKELADVSNPNFIVALGEKFYFISNGRLYASDGTAGGTVALFNFSASTEDYQFAFVNRLYAINNKLFLIVDYTVQSNNLPGTRLWVSNGTAEGTVPISKDAVFPDQLTAGPDGLIYFSARKYNESGRKLWVTNSQPGNMQIVAEAQDIIVKQGDVIKIADNAIYFAGYQANNISEKLYKFQHDQLSLVKDFREGDRTAYINNLKKVAGGLYLGISFSGTVSPFKSQLWKSDGTTNGTLLVKDSCSLGTSIELNGKLLFYGVGPDRQNWEPWISDGTEAGTAQLKEIAPGNRGSYGDLTVFSPINNQLLFQANDGPHGLELWKTNGTAASTTLLKDINTSSTGSSNIVLPTALNNKLLFLAGDGVGPGMGLWASDGTTAGTSVSNNVAVSNIYKQGVTTLARLKDDVFADGYDSLQSAYGLLKSNGNSPNTVLVKAFDKNRQLIVWLRATSTLIYFELFDATSYTRSLWRSDGTAQGTYTVTELTSEVVFDTYNKIYPTAVDSVLYFLQKDNNSRPQLWKTNGTVGGTAFVTDISQEFDPGFSNFMAFHGFLYFSARNNQGRQLFKTGGQQGATSIAVSYCSTTGHFTVAGGQLYFAAYIQFNSDGIELWRMNPSTDSVYLVKSGSPSGNSPPVQLVNADGNVFFFANDGVHGQELWKTDGTEQGTKLVKDITPGAASSFPISGAGPNIYTTGINGKIFFILNDTLWVSDGTDTGTVKVNDNGLAGLQYFRNLVAVDNRLYFVATTYTKGEELYSAVVPSVYRTTYTFTGSGRFTDAANWTSGQKPPTEIPKGVEVIIAPGATGECIIDIPVTLKGGKLTIAKNAKVIFLSK